MTPLIAQATGTIQGGWEFIWAAYGAVWLFFGSYAISLFIRAHRKGDKS